MVSHRITIVALFAAAGLLAACAPAAPTAAPVVAPAAGPTATRAPLTPTGKGSLRIGVLPITDVVPFYIADAQGYFKQHGVSVELIPVSSAAERDQLMATQQIDGQLNDLVSTVLFNAQGPKIKIVRKARQAFSNSAEYWILTSENSAIKTPQDLKGKEIAISQNSVIEYVTQRLLEQEGLTASDIKTTNVPSIPTRLQLLQQGQVAAATLPDPLASLAIQQGARIVVDDTKHPEYSISVISFRDDVIAQRPEDVKSFLAAYDQAIDAIRTKPEQFRNILIDKGRVPDPLKDQYQFPPFPDPSVPSQAQWDDVVNWAMSKKLIRAPVTFDSSVDSGFVN
ncbi:MAG: MetQ/NlpA family ABC transporter substrate-binding protein [Chloroflexi bacterium]|nr:MetQ/NlpA family ABC transporter substrate-binding protein [Chloroflexota bacterium]